MGGTAEVTCKDCGYVEEYATGSGMRTHPDSDELFACSHCHTLQTHSIKDFYSTGGRTVTVFPQCTDCDRPLKWISVGDDCVSDLGCHDVHCKRCGRGELSVSKGEILWD